jgi:hypothetical protein
MGFTEEDSTGADDHINGHGTVNHGTMMVWLKVFVIFPELLML